MQGSLSQLQFIVQKSVAHFVKETLTTPTEEQASSLTLSMRTLFWLYEEWRLFRGVSDRLKIMNQRTFSYVFTHLDPAATGIQPPARKTKQITRRFITVPEQPVFLTPSPVALIPEPAIMSLSGLPNIGIASGPFDARASLKHAPEDIKEHLDRLEKYAKLS